MKAYAKRKKGVNTRFRRNIFLDFCAFLTAYCVFVNETFQPDRQDFCSEIYLDYCTQSQSIRRWKIYWKCSRQEFWRRECRKLQVSDIYHIWYGLFPHSLFTFKLADIRYFSDPNLEGRIYFNLIVGGFHYLFRDKYIIPFSFFHFSIRL